MTCKYGDPACPQCYDCGRCKRERYEAIWRRMTPGQRAYDRMVDPMGAYTCGISVPGGDRFMYTNDSCSCHINPPCSYCVNRSIEEYADE